MMEHLSVEHSNADPVDTSQPPLDERVLSIIRSCKHLTIRPARVASELGISVNDACAELCGLMGAVGGGHNGASFAFERVEKGPPTMVFTFPNDFEKRARHTRRKQDFYQTMYKVMSVLIKGLKIVTAFGLVLSLLILTVAGIIGTVAVIIALSRGGGSDQHRASMFRRVRSMFYTIRQLLWCYAMFGDNFEGHDPFMSEIAYDASLCLSMCCGNPASFLFWIRAGQLNRRRARATRSWGRGFGRHDAGTTEIGALIQQDAHRGENGDVITNSEEYRGILSVAVEFLFGPIPFNPGPTEPEKWKLRGAVIMEHASKQGSSSLQELGPFADSPAKSLNDDSSMVTNGLAIVAHYNGVPEQNDSFNNTSKAKFVFPELVAEANHVTQFDDTLDLDDGTFDYLLFNPAVTIVPQQRSCLPSFLQERRYRLTHLQSKQLFHCIGLGALNWIGVVCLRQSLQFGGILQQAMNGSPVVTFLVDWLCPVLIFYANLFFILPVGRLGVILILNWFREGRNRKRSEIAEALRVSTAILGNAAGMESSL